MSIICSVYFGNSTVKPHQSLSNDWYTTLRKVERDGDLAQVELAHVSCFNYHLSTMHRIWTAQDVVHGNLVSLSMRS